MHKRDDKTFKESNVERQDMQRDMGKNRIILRREVGKSVRGE